MKFIRWKGLIPFVLVTAAVYVFATFYMDALLKRTLVKQGTKLNGALVDVDGVSLSFLRSRFEIRGLRATDPSDLMKNRLDVRSIVADLRFLPLLKKKVVIEDMTIADVKWATDRKKAGKVPAAWAKEWEAEAKEESLFAQALEELKTKFKAEFPELSADQLGERFDPRNFVKLEDIQVYQTAKALPEETKALLSEWQTKSKGFVAERKASVDQLKAKIQKLDPRTMKNPQQILQAIQTVQSLEGEIKSQRDAVTGMVADANTAIKDQGKKILGMKDQLRSDIENLKKKIGFGDFKLDNLSEMIFGLSIVDRYQQYMGYYTTGKTYLDKYKGKEKAPKKERAKGRVVYFPVTDFTPPFLLQHALLSSDTRTNTTVPEAARGEFKAEAKDITSHPRMTGRPMLVDLSALMAGGRFKSAGLGFSYVDRDLSPTTQVKGNLSGFSLGSFELGKGSAFSLPLGGGEADWSTDVRISGDSITAKLAGDFKKLTYDFPKEQKGSYILKILRDVIAEIRAFKVKIDITGELKRPRFAISSTFDNALRDGLEKTLMKEVRKAQAKLEAYLQKEIGSKIQEAEAVFNSKKQDVLNQLKGQMAKVDEVKKLSEKKINELKAKQNALIGKQTDKIGDSIKKGFKF